jgi:uncharacterized delta-60 repeat protein
MIKRARLFPSLFTSFLIVISLFVSAQAAPGDLDPTFGNSGKVVTPDFRPDPAASSSADAMVIQPDGKIVVAGTSGELAGINYNYYLIMARYNPNGTLDQSFGTGGKVVPDIAGTQVEIYAMALQPDGKLLVGGAVLIGPANTDGNQGYNFAVLRFNSNGTLDSTFGVGGIATTDYSGGTTNDDKIYSLAVQPDGKIVAGGYTRMGSTVDFAIARYNPNGTLDTSFGNGGKLSTPFSTADDVIKALLLQPDGKIVAVGYLSVPLTADFDFAVARYNSNGTLDTSFGSGGIASTGFNTGRDEFALAAVLQPDGKIVAGGYARTFNNVSTDFALVRYNTNGELDASFGTGGRALADFFGLGDRVYGLALQANGKIVAAGYATVPTSPFSNQDFGIARFNRNGFLDATFGANGKTTTNFGGGRETDQAHAVAVQTDGKIVAAGFGGTQPNTSSRLALARFIGDPPNSLSRTFDFDGDGRSDISVFRDGVWYAQQSSAGFVATQWGAAGDQLVPGDYDGDGKTDLAVFRRSANSTWYILQSSTNQFRAVQWGANRNEQAILFDTPVPADYDGDGRTDIAVYRTTDFISEPGRFLILQSSDNTPRSRQWGLPSDRPMPADYDGDGKADLAVYRANEGAWYILQSWDNAVRAEQFGISSDTPVGGDFDGDGKADLAVFRSSEGAWYMRQSSSGFRGVHFGTAGDVPVAADYDGDGKADIAVFRAGDWYILKSTDGFAGERFGLATDIPIMAPRP